MQAEPLFLVSVPRAGTNLVAALLHRHPAVWSLTYKETLRQIKTGWRGLGNMLDADHLPERDSVYPRAAPAKDADAVRYVLFDKCPPGEPLPVGKRLVLTRSPFGILWSRHQFAVRYGRKQWRATRANIRRFVRDEYLPLLKAAGYRMALEPVARDGEIGRAAWDWLDVDPFANLDLAPTSACCGAGWAVRDTTAVASAWLESRHPDLSPRPHYHCTGCGEPLIGYGGYNPYRPISYERVMRWQDEMPGAMYAMIEDVLNEYR